jgi:hypothetical protein
LKTKPHLVPLSVIQPELVVALAVVYIDHGRWDIARGGIGGAFAVEQPSAFAAGEADGVPAWRSRSVSFRRGLVFQV